MSEPTIWQLLAVPFPPEAIRHYKGRGGIEFSYVSARDVMNRLDEVVTPAGWSFEWELIDSSEHVVKGRLTINTEIALIREDAGYPNADTDDEPLKSAVSDALKRCAVHFGIGRHLYDDKAKTQRVNVPPAQDAPQREATTRRMEADGDPNSIICACGTERVFRSGTGKNGKPWSAWMCASRPGKCEPIWGGRDHFTKQQQGALDGMPAPIEDDYDSVPF